MATDALIFADQLEHLNELADAVLDRLDDSGHMFYPCDDPIYDDMLFYFGDPHFVVPPFAW